MDTRLAQAIQSLSAHPHQRFSLSVLSQEVHLSERRLEQLFKVQVGMSFVAFSRELRMRRARQLLMETS